MLLSILKLAHILSAMVGLGFNLSYPLWLRKLSNVTGEALVFGLQGIRHIDRVANIGYTVALITGLGLAHLGRHDLMSPWLGCSLLLFVVSLGLAHGVYTPALKAQIVLAKDGKDDMDHYVALEKRSTAVGMALTLTALTILGLMVFKPQF